MICKVIIIVHSVPVHRPVGVGVGNEVSFQLGAVRGIGRALLVEVIVFRCGLGWRDERRLESECHRRRHHHDGNASTES